ncbi:MAG TPA: hypothetical protein PKJ99_15355 [Thermoanaerobaculales bacterium]|nr:hypothetical protein [Thermoanaerobaculales bacterium]HPA79334.1 hypothetical protein [Thermoanaerobaculales bacterium]HQL30204.1 hypothetical protein [Thermoanaerobaculales bacterium]HQN96173.1 hypothetical protein [Thermoanaerobaculales bacterium]HQP43102.1 hypothetical protein [Thermoanaerobaculales bacterium]
MRRTSMAGDRRGAPLEIVALPDGVTEDQWQRELDGWQNPRLRALLGCLRRLDGAHESNVAILNCSPARLTVMWATVREVAGLIRTDLAPLLAEPSPIPALDASRQSVAAGLGHLDATLFAQIDALPRDVVARDEHELRRFLCAAVGQIHAFLQDSFGSLMASDPRGRHDADYYLSKEFPRDVEESEWLYASVLALDADFRDIERERRAIFPPVLERIAGHQHLPDPAEWAAMHAFLRRLGADFAARLRTILLLRAIRLTELELLSHHATEIPITCRVLIELHESGRQSVSALSFARAAQADGEVGQRMAMLVDATVSGRLLPHARALDDSLRDLGAFIPIWRQGISQRRALAFRGTGNPVPGGKPAAARS